MTKQVLVIPQSTLINNDIWPNQVARDHGFLVDKEIAEKNPDLLQIIPYVIIGDENDNQLVATYYRGGESERRLDTLRSCGFGGHVEKRGSFAVSDAAHRELKEEVNFETRDRLFVGWIRTYDEVGRVHLGACYYTEGGRDELTPSAATGPIEWLHRRTIQGIEWEPWSVSAAYLVAACLGR